MSVDALNALQCETDFLSGVGRKLDAARGKHLRGTIWKESRRDDEDRLRALMAENKNYDRELLKSLPANRRVVLHGFERKLLFWKRPTGVAVASVVSPLSHYASANAGAGPPIGLAELMDHVRKLVGDSRTPHIIGVCAPTGFSQDAREMKPDGTNVTVVLIEPDGQGGWHTTPTVDSVDPRIIKMFDPEQPSDKANRVRSFIDEHSADLLTGSMSASSVAQKTGLSEVVVRAGFEEAARKDGELKVSKKDGEFLLFRGAPIRAGEKKTMNVIDRIRQLFSGEGDENEKIDLLAERRAALSQRRDRIYEDISKLEDKEHGLFEQGKAAKSQVPRRRLAAQLAQLRKDIARQNTTAAMLNQQINIISTDIHNLTLIQQGEMAQLPDTVELTENAVRAEELLESLKADSELVGALDGGIEESLTSDEELAILREFDASDTPDPAAPSPASPSVAASQETTGQRGEPTDAAEEPSAAPKEDERRGDAEPT